MSVGGVQNDVLTEQKVLSRLHRLTKIEMVQNLRVHYHSGGKTEDDNIAAETGSAFQVIKWKHSLHGGFHSPAKTSDPLWPVRIVSFHSLYLSGHNLSWNVCIQKYNQTKHFVSFTSV